MANEYAERQCPHNRCLNHNPNFGSPTEEKADFKPSWLFKMAIYMKHFYCCEKRMKIELINLVNSCVECGRKESWLHKYGLLCECCGYHTKIDVNWVRDRENDIRLRFWLGSLIISVIALAASIGLAGISGLSVIIFFISTITMMISIVKIFKN